MKEYNTMVLIKLIISVRQRVTVLHLNEKYLELTRGSSCVAMYHTIHLWSIMAHIYTYSPCT